MFRSQTADNMIRVRLRTKFLLGIIVLECVLMSAIILVVETRMRRTAMDEFRKRGLSIAKNLAAVNTNYVVTYNYVNVEQNVIQVVEENELLYAAVLLYDGELASYAGSADMEKQVLGGVLQKRAMEAIDPLVQYDRADGKEFCDITVPIFLKHEKWGTIRCGFSLDDIHAAVIKTRKVLISLGFVGLFFGCLASLVLSGRITRPIGKLVESVEAISNGDYDRSITVDTHDEIAYFGYRFMAMQERLKENINELTDTNQKLAMTNEKLEFEILERRWAEEALRVAMEEAMAANVAKSQFLANVSHEIRTPMNVLFGMTELLLSTELTDKQREYASYLYHSEKGLLDVINSILDFSSMEAGRLELDKTDFNLLHTVEDTVTFLARSAWDKGLEPTCRIDHDVPLLLRGDPGRLRQVLIIIISNAVKFTNEGEVNVTVRLAEKQNTSAMIRFEITDTGIGIDPDLRELIFDTFSQADGSLTRRYEGLGLGLAIAKQLTSMMGGEIGVESEPEKGSTFWFTVRLDFQAAGSDFPQKALELPLNFKVLVVDDNAASRSNLIYYLSHWEIQGRKAESGEEALTILQDNAATHEPFHAAFVDVDLAGIDGLATARRIKSHPYTARVLPVMLLPSGLAAEEKDEVLRQFPVYLEKPIRLLRLHECLATLTGQGADPIPPAIRVESMAETVTDRFDGHVLLVEDNPVNLELTREKLKVLGCRVDAVTNGQEAVHAFVENQFDLIAMDCQMPVMDGYEATKQIREQERFLKPSLPRVPIIALTAHAMNGDRDKCLGVGMDDYLAKPFNLGQLADMLGRWMEAKN